MSFNGKEMKPRLPDFLEKRLPSKVLHHLYSFVPHMPIQTWPNGTYAHIKKLQNSPKRTAMDLKGMDDFVLK